jgi:hypothetical protein
VDSLKAKSDVSGLQFYSIQVDKEMRANGKGKSWRDEGSIYIGRWRDDKRTEGKKYELQADDTHTLFHVKHNEGWNKEIEKKEISKGHKMV